VIPVDEGIEQAETDSWNNEQVHGGNIWGMIAQEGEPSLAWRSPSFDHVLGNVNRVVLTLRRSLPVFLDKQTYSAATAIGCKGQNRLAGHLGRLPEAARARSDAWMAPKHHPAPLSGGDITNTK
jgi:hypothetical protein